MLQWAISQLLSYDPVTWVVFVAIALVAARVGRLPGAMVGHVLITVVVAASDVAWIRSEMERPGWSPQTGPDQDIVFYMGAMLRVALINTALLPVSVLGVWMARRAARGRES